MCSFSRHMQLACQEVRNSRTGLYFLHHWTPPAPMKTVLMGGSEETRSWTSEDEGPRWARSAPWDGNGEETSNMQLAEPVEDLTRKCWDMFPLISFVCCLSLRMVSLGSLGDMLTCSHFRLCEERASRFPSGFIQDVERIVDF